MKNYKQFRAEQQYITEVGPFASAMMVAMGAVGLGFAGWKLFKAGKEKIKGYRETKAEKKANRESGVEIEVKKINPDTGEEYEELVTLSGSAANLDADGVEKERKKLQKKYDNSDKGRDKAAANEKIRAALGKGPKDIITKDDKKKGMNILSDPEGTGMGSEVGKARDKKEKEASDAAAKEKKSKADASKSVKDWMGAEVDEIPTGMKPKVKEKERKELGGHKDVLAYMDRWDVDSVEGWKKKTDPNDPDDFEYVQTEESKVLSFGEFITEGVMNDLLKAGKSKKDSEISLDDGADIPIDPLTSQILVKYIEGLSSSEKNRTIQQIQRTERAFMKVLGKAHENT